MPSPRMVAAVLAALAVLSPIQAAPRINEFLTINGSGLVDGDGDREDWIEIHNPDGASLDLSGWFLTDDVAQPTRWAFPEGTAIAGGGYLVVFASAKPAPPPGELHASFKLSSGGEYLALVAPDGVTVVDSFAPEFPPQYADISYGVAAGGERRYFTTPTPGAANVGGIGNPAAEVQFDPLSGTFSGTASVTLSGANPAAAIHYTTDGSDPDVSSPVYVSPISLDRTTEIRARLIVPGEDPGPINSASYIRLAADVQDFDSPLPIVVIENFGAGAIPDKRAHNPPAGDGSGITQVPRQPAFFAIVDRGEGGIARLSDAPALASRMGIRVRGSSSASQPAKKENYNLEMWGAVDEDLVEIAPFGMPAENDWVLYAPYNYDRALIRNAFVFELMRRMGHYAVRTQFVEVFVNTEGDDLSMADFAGVFVFMEKIKQSDERVDIDDFAADGTSGGWLLESNRMDPLPEDGSGTPPYNFHTAGPNRVKEGPYGGSGSTDRGGDDIPTGYNTFLNFVEPTGYGTTAAQRHAIVRWFDEFEDVLYGPDFRRPDIGYRAWLDLDSFIDHYLMVNLTRNVDGLQLSTFMYRPKTYGKLHLNPVWDYDRSIDSYDGRDNSPTGMWAQQFLWFPRLFSDPEFSQQHVDRWQELRRGPLSTANIDALIDAMADEITEPVAAANFARWNASTNRPRSGGWPAELNHMKGWLASRAEWIDGQFLSPPEISESGGEIAITAADGGTIYYTLDGRDPRMPDLPGAEIELISAMAPARGLVPSEVNGGDQLGASWKGGAEPFDDSGWLAGATGLGFGYDGLVGIDVGAMRGQTGSSYLRVPFSIDAGTLATLQSLTLNLKFEDGFVAWLNGTKVASFNEPVPLNWDSDCGVSRSENDALAYEPFDLTAHVGALRPGTNVLAIQAMNSSVINADLLVLPQLVASTGSSGGVSPGAQTYTGPIELSEATKVVARLESNGSWSGPVDATFLVNTVPADLTNLVISEIMYRPLDATEAEEFAGFSDRDAFEFIELLNISASETINLSGVRFVQTNNNGDVQGIEFDFDSAAIQFLRPGERLVLVENEEAFLLRYGRGRPVAGVFGGNIDNDGERLTLLDRGGLTIRDFTYNDQLPWPTQADGDGYSLVLIGPESNPDHTNPANWRPSLAVHGTPGRDEGWGPEFTGLANADNDGDRLPALGEFALGTSDEDGSSGPDRYRISGDSGEIRLTATVDLAAPGVRVIPEVSLDLVAWFEDPGDGTLIEMVERIHHGNGSETLAWRPKVPDAPIFLRLKFELLGSE